jgi:predicted porin
MKKTLVAIAALAAFGAQAQSSVTLYGNLDQGIYRQTDSGVTQSAISSNVNSTSTLGFRGTEDLGGGTSANFHLLSELSLPQGQVGSTTSGDAATTGQKSNLFTRAATVGLSSSSFGSFDIGRIQDAVWLTQGAFNNTGSNSFGWGAYTATQTNFGDLAARGFGSAAANTTYSGTSGASGVANNAEGGTAPVNFNAGWSYSTPVFAGFKGTYQHVGRQFQATTSPAGGSGDAYRVEYTNGPLNVQYAQTSRQDATDNLGAKWKVLGATYQLGAAKLVAAQSKLTTANGFSNINGNTINGFGVIYDVNAKVDVGAGYTTIKNDQSTTAVDSKLLGLTARYKFSKRTQVYVGYGHETNNGTSNKMTMLYGGPSGTTAGGVSSTGYLVGIRHGF